MIDSNAERLKEYQDKYKKQYDLRNNSNVYLFREGDCCQYLNSQVAVSKGGKMEHQYLPPDNFVIIDYINYDNHHVNLRRRDGTLMSKTYHVNKLRLWNKEGVQVGNDPLLEVLDNAVDVVNNNLQSMVNTDVIEVPDDNADQLMDKVIDVSPPSSRTRSRRKRKVEEDDVDVVDEKYDKKQTTTSRGRVTTSFILPERKKRRKKGT